MRGRHGTCEVDIEKVEALIKNASLTLGEVLQRGAQTLRVKSPNVRIFSRARHRSVQVNGAEVIAAGLNVDLEEILIDPQATHTPELFSGMWEAYFIEEKYNIETYIVIESIKLYSTEGGLLGEIIPVKPKWSRRERLVSLSAEGNMLSGRGLIVEEASPKGVNFFQLKLSDDGLFMDGVVSWYSSDYDRIMWSRYMWVKAANKASRQQVLAEDRSRNLVLRKMQEELEIYPIYKSRLIN
jgi:hypothetical protein